MIPCHEFNVFKIKAYVLSIIESTVTNHAYNMATIVSYCINQVEEAFIDWRIILLSDPTVRIASLTLIIL